MSHERLLAPVAWAFAGGCRCESERRESHRHNSDVVGYVEYSSKTLTGFSQLCWECNRTALRRTRLGVVQHSFLEYPRVEPFADQSRDHPITHPMLEKRP
jgi:hypothetical protein